MVGMENEIYFVRGCGVALGAVAFVLCTAMNGKHHDISYLSCSGKAIVHFKTAN